MTRDLWILHEAAGAGPGPSGDPSASSGSLSPFRALLAPSRLRAESCCSGTVTALIEESYSAQGRGSVCFQEEASVSVPPPPVLPELLER